MSHAIKLIQCAMQRMFSIWGYFSFIIILALRIFAALSDTIAANFSVPIFLRTSSIFSAKKIAVCEFNDKSDSWYKYSLRDRVRIIKFQIDLLSPEVQPSIAIKN